MKQVGVILILALAMLLSAGACAFPDDGTTQIGDVNVNLVQKTFGDGGSDVQIGKINIDLTQIIFNWDGYGCHDNNCGDNDDGKDKDKVTAPKAGLLHPDKPLGFQGHARPLVNYDCSAWSNPAKCPIPFST